MIIWDHYQIWMPNLILLMLVIMPRKSELCAKSWMRDPSHDGGSDGFLIMTKRQSEHTQQQRHCIDPVDETQQHLSKSRH